MFFCFFSFLCSVATSYSQQMTLDEAIGTARGNSVAALEAKAAFVSDYWAWRSYQASRLPSLHLYGTVGGFDRSLHSIEVPDENAARNSRKTEIVYTENYSMQNSLGLRVKQNVSMTGGTMYLYSDLTRVDQFAAEKNSRLSWYSQPVTLSYVQPLFSYNKFKWDRLISPKEYEKAKRTYLESMEDVTLQAVDRFFEVLEADNLYEI